MKSVIIQLYLLSLNVKCKTNENKLLFISKLPVNINRFFSKLLEFNIEFNPLKFNASHSEVLSNIFLLSVLGNYFSIIISYLFVIELS